MSLTVNNIENYNNMSEFCIKEKFVFFYGESLDLRGKETEKLINESSMSILIKYIPEKGFININSDEFPHYMLMNFIEKLDTDYILIESTTLSVAEILLLLHYINQLENDIKLSILYVEPEEYKLKDIKDNFQEFELSNHFEGFYNIRPYNLLIDSTTNNKEKAEIVVLLGFEDNRIGYLLEMDEGQKYKSYVPLLGLPAFRTGWENIALSRNIRHFNSDFKKLEFAGASNPYQVMNKLEEIKNKSDYEKILIAAFGTKPSAIGTSLFLVNNFKNKNNKVGIIYDFPKKKENRTMGTGKVYNYIIKKQ